MRTKNRQSLKSAKQYNILLVLLMLFLLHSRVVFADDPVSQYGNFPYAQSFFTAQEPAEITKPDASGTASNAADYTDNGLLLTPLDQYLFGGVFVNDRQFGSTNGVKIEFEYMMYDGTGGDGISMFLFDASTASPSIGAAGAGIGYTYNQTDGTATHSQHTAEGLHGAYLGVALDAYGNFKTARYQGESRVNGIAYKKSSFTSVAGALDPTYDTGNHVTLRGTFLNRAIDTTVVRSGASVTLNVPVGYAGYPVLITQATNTQYGVIKEDDLSGTYTLTSDYSGNKFNLSGGTTFESDDEAAYRKAMIELYPVPSGLGGGFYITVKIQHGKQVDVIIDNYQYKESFYYQENALIPYRYNEDIPTSDPLTLPVTAKIPQFLRIGFAAATGEKTNKNVIKNVRITLPGSAEANDDISTTRIDVPVDIDPFVNDIAYEGIISQNMVGSNSHINPATFRFRLADGSTPDSDYSHQATEGLWEYDPLTGLVTFTPASGFAGNATIQYDIKGGLPGNTDPYADEAYRSLPANIEVIVEDCSAVLVWTGNTDSDWDKTANWYPNQIPDDCADVYIPGNVAVFPTLLASGTNTCRNIYFMPGAQLGRPDLLTYTQAHVQLDYGAGSLGARATVSKEELVATGRNNITSEQRLQFGIATAGVTLSRGRWNMLSAPLGNIVAGDFAFGGFPFSYIKKFDANGSASSYIMGSWADFSGEADFTFQPGQGFGHYYYSYMANTPYGMDNSAGNIQWNAAKSYSNLTADTPVHIDGSNEFGLAQSNGVLHFPYFSDAYMSTARRAHQYTGTANAGTSTFDFFWYNPLTSSDFLQFNGNRESVSRTNAAYRFITENWNEEYNAGTFAANDIVLVGNPYMSALDFDQFYLQNSSKIKQVYNIYQTTNTYFTYMGDGSANRLIAPMQSFLVETQVAGELNLTFDVTTMAVTNPGTVLKASRVAAANQLTITATNSYGETSVYLRRMQNAANGFDHHDFSQIIDKPDNKPRVYTLVDNMGSSQRALLMNSVDGNDAIVPIGLVSTGDDEIDLTISGMDNYADEVYFIDEQENTEVKISGQATYTYAFEHDPNKSQRVENRFKLRFSPRETTGLEENGTESGITAYTTGNDLVIISSDSDKIGLVMIYDLQGRCLMQKDTGGITFCKIEDVFHTTGVYIVRVHTEKGIKKIKIII